MGHPVRAVPEWAPVGGCRVMALALCAPSSAPRVITLPVMRYLETDVVGMFPDGFRPRV